VFAGGDRGLDVHRTEVRRGSKQNNIRHLDDFLVGVEANELVLFGHVEFRRDRLLFFQRR
jgi:hypothetical protein